MRYSWPAVWDGCGGFGMGGWIPMILFWMFLILAGVIMIRFIAQRTDLTDKGDQALKILRDRYARGEITKKEFEEMKKTLE